MEWLEIKDFILAIMGIIGCGGLIAIYKAKPEKSNLEIKNVHDAMDIQKELIRSLDKRVDGLNREVRTLNHRVELKHEVIYSAYGCRLITSPDDCVVIKQYHDKCLSCSLHEGYNCDNDDE